VQQRLRSSKWDSRTAAGECLSQIAAHCQHHSAADLQAAASAAGASTQDDVDDGDQKADASLLSFQGFSIDKVLQHGTLLLASGGKVCYEASPKLDNFATWQEAVRAGHKSEAFQLLAPSSSSTFEAPAACACMLNYQQTKA